MPAKAMAVRPAAGPLTLRAELLIMPTTIPPITPVISPEISGAPDAWAIPRHRGTATKNTAIPAGKSYFKFSLDMGDNVFRSIFNAN
jgi:hypothetical protein